MWWHSYIHLSINSSLNLSIPYSLQLSTHLRHQLILPPTLRLSLPSSHLSFIHSLIQLSINPFIHPSCLTSINPSIRSFPSLIYHFLPLFIYPSTHSFRHRSSLVSQTQVWSYSNSVWWRFHLQKRKCDHSFRANFQRSSSNRQKNHYFKKCCQWRKNWCLRCWSSLRHGYPWN